MKKMKKVGKVGKKVKEEVEEKEKVREMKERVKIAWTLIMPSHHHEKGEKGSNYSMMLNV